MDDHVLPLDLTIYGAIHQHEARKNSGATASSSAIWQGVYPVKFRKIMAPAPECKQNGHTSLTRQLTPYSTF